MLKKMVALTLFSALALQACAAENKKASVKPAPVEEPQDETDKETDGDKKPEVVTITISPTTSALETGGSETFTATVAGTTEKGVTWSVVEVDGGTVTTGGVYTAPLAAGTYHVKATSTKDTTKSATATITVTEPVVEGVSVSVAPLNSAAVPGDQIDFTATVAGSADQGVSWSVDEVDGGTINNNGRYTAPAVAGVFHIRATSDADNTKSGVATVTVTVTAPSIVVNISPDGGTVYIDEQIDFGVSVDNANNQVSWSVIGGDANGIINNGGTYTAPSTPGVYTIRATSDHDAAAYDEVQVTVTVPTFAVTMIPLSASVETGATFDFDAEVAGPTFGNPVTWYVVEANGGNVGGSGGYTAPLEVGTYHVVAVSKDAPAQTATGTITVVAANPIISITPLSASMDTEATRSFSVSVTNSIWNKFAIKLTGDGYLNKSVGMGSTTVLYTSATTIAVNTIVATTANLPAKTATATVDVHAPTVYISVWPSVVTGYTGNDFEFDSSVTGSVYNGAEWSVYGSSPTNGTVDMYGNYTAPETEGTYYVRLTSTKVPGVYGEVTVKVYAPVCPANDKVFAYYDAGLDTEWQNDDDQLLAYSRFSYAADSTYRTHHRYSQFNSPTLDTPANNVTAVTTVDGIGPDGLWGTKDDLVTGYFTVSYDMHGRETGYAAMDAGADGKLGTADDIIKGGEIILYTDQVPSGPEGALSPGYSLLVAEVRAYVYPGNNGVQDSEVTHRSIFEYTNLYFYPGYYYDVLDRVYNYSTGTDGIIGSGDDTLLDYNMVSYDYYDMWNYGAHDPYPTAFETYGINDRATVREAYNSYYGNWHGRGEPTQPITFQHYTGNGWKTSSSERMSYDDTAPGLSKVRTLDKNENTTGYAEAFMCP